MVLQVTMNYNSGTKQAHIIHCRHSIGSQYCLHRVLGIITMRKSYVKMESFRK